MEELKYYNEYGGFSEDGKEYHIKVNKNNKLPTVWSHMLTNPNFGTVVTESMGGYTWSKNSRLNKLTAWGNNHITDIPSEIMYLKDEDSNVFWSIGSFPAPDNDDYYIKYGFGYAKYTHTSYDIHQELEVFVPEKDSVKINILNLRNNSVTKKNLKLVYYIKPVLAEDEIKSNGYINLEINRESNLITFKNLYNTDFKNSIGFVSSSEKIIAFTGNKKNFIGEGNLSKPDGIINMNLDNQNGIGSDACVAIELNIKLDALSEKEVIIMLGCEEDIIDLKDTAYKYSKIQNCREELTNIKKYWEEKLSAIIIKTPFESMNLILNYWMPYQTITSRLWGKTGYYQSGGAIGFRDQLQDTLGLKYISPEYMKTQILKHAAHQFIEGDVEHWWHEETKRGIRTRFSDDLLWLAYVVYEYIDMTGDYNILNENVPYILGNTLKPGIDEDYDIHHESIVVENIYNHCIRAIEKSLNFGKNGLPKIGSGDWNDGFSEVGNKGIGESVWLGFFLYDILNKFIKISESKYLETFYANPEKLSQMGPPVSKKFAKCLDARMRFKKYKQIAENLRKALNTNGWDGRWFKRAFTDDGKVLGTMENEECKIDGISQSWAVISNAGDNDKQFICMEALENHLVDKENGIIKLLDPPFEKSDLEPGYIKAYLPGIRENGGQYTHRCNLEYNGTDYSWIWR